MSLASNSNTAEKWALQNSCLQWLCPSSSPEGSPGLANGSAPGSFQTTASMLIQVVRDCTNPLTEKSLFPIALLLSWTEALLVFKARHSRGSCSWCRIPGLGSSTWGSDPSLLAENFYHCDIPPICGLPTLKVWVLTILSPPFLLILLWFLIFKFLLYIGAQLINNIVLEVYSKVIRYTYTCIYSFSNYFPV